MILVSILYIYKAPVVLAVSLGLGFFCSSAGTTINWNQWIEIKRMFEEVVMIICVLETRKEILQRKYNRKTDEGNVSSKNTTDDPLQFFSWCFYSAFELPHDPSLTLFFCQLFLTMTLFCLPPQFTIQFLKQNIIQEI